MRRAFNKLASIIAAINAMSGKIPDLNNKDVEGVAGKIRLPRFDHGDHFYSYLSWKRSKKGKWQVRK